jgi:hypothetical protein
VQKQVHSAVEHAHAHHPPSSPGSPAAGQASSGDGTRQQTAQAQAAGQQDFVAGVELSLPFKLAPADGLRTPFTNHVKGYQGLLDYVW